MWCQILPAHFSVPLAATKFFISPSLIQWGGNRKFPRERKSNWCEVCNGRHPPERLLPLSQDLREAQGRQCPEMAQMRDSKSDPHEQKSCLLKGLSPKVTGVFQQEFWKYQWSQVWALGTMKWWLQLWLTHIWDFPRSLAHAILVVKGAGTLRQLGISYIPPVPPPSPGPVRPGGTTASMLIDPQVRISLWQLLCPHRFWEENLEVHNLQTSFSPLSGSFSATVSISSITKTFWKGPVSKLQTSPMIHPFYSFFLNIGWSGWGAWFLVILSHDGIGTSGRHETES